MRIVAVLALVAGAAGCSRGVSVNRPSPRGVVVQGFFTRYPVEGATVQEIGRDLARGPLIDGRRFAGHYRYNMRWSYRTTSLGGGCRVSTVRIDLESTIMLPEWRRPANAPQELADMWEQFIQALDDHEREHERRAVVEAGELVRRLEQLREPTCLALSAEANREWQRAVDRLRDQQSALDDQTGHGATMGARWPPPAAPARQPPS